jgi:inner membrane protein
MDNLTHSLVGVALSRAGLQRVTPHATLLLIISSNLPDIDILALAGGQLADLEIHRGYTHSLILIPLLAIVSALLTMVIGDQPVRFWRAFFVGCVGVGGHLLLDWTGSFGIRALLPFSSKWFYLDLNGFYDGVILTALALAFVWPWFVDLVSSEIGRNTKHRGQGSALFVLFFLMLYEGGRWTLHQRVLNDLNSRLYDGQVPLEVSALAEPNDPFHWTGIVETDDAFRMVRTGAIALINSTDARIFRKPRQNPVYLAVNRVEPFRYMAYFSRFPVWDFEPIKLASGLGERVEETDLRFGTPGAGEFHASALTDPVGRVLETEFGFTTREMDEMFASAPQ